MTTADQMAEALAQPTLCAAFQVTAAAGGERTALRTYGRDEDLTWREYAERVERIAAGLASLGVGAGDTVAVMLGNRSEFHLVDLAAMHLGAAPFSIYNSNPASKIAPLVANSEAEVAITETSLAGQILEAREMGCGLRRVIVVDEAAPADTMTLSDLERRPTPAGFDFEATWRSVRADMLATIVYTSGTTGNPKGAEWTHEALMGDLRAMDEFLHIGPGQRWLSYLPMAHLAERFFSHYTSMVAGYEITSLADPSALVEALRSIRPTRFFGVPRTYEKLVELIRPTLDADPTDVETARSLIGFDAIEFLGSAAAPARVDILDTFSLLGVPIVENWGSTETGMTLVNPPDRVKAGTVGVPLPGFSAKLSPDGELLVKGPMFSRYRDAPEQTKEAFTDDGFYRTGDVASIDDEGYFTIVDRKKEILITTTGKNVPPVAIENAIKRESPLVAYAVAVGDGRGYIAVLLALDEQELADWGTAEGFVEGTAELRRRPELQRLLDEAIDRANKHFSRPEQVKRFAVLADTWMPGDDVLTPTSKVRRRVVASRYAAEIDGLYASAPGSSSSR